ncbi:MAG: polysulfide reductase [Dehalococcoidia bacterium]|nr:MAG: polysulfide reductase [Dehalococcoidia bacterium]
MEAVAVRQRRLEDTTLAPIRKTSALYWVWVAFLAAVIAWGGYAYYYQLRHGLIVTGMRDRISWGFYITNFVFFIGISHAGTLISAILRVSKAGWRTPVTRMAEFITVVALCCGALFPIIDLGRPDRVLNVIIHGRWQSPIIWDVVAITTYLTASVTYLFLPMIPDLALFRDRTSGIRKRLYTLLSVGWSGEKTQRTMLATALAVMMILIIPIAVSVHTVVSWIFAMNMRVSWNSTIFGAFFVAGAIFSGVATLIIVMAILRKVYHLEEYITEKHFIYLGYLLGAFALIMIYGNLSEYITTGYKMEAGEEFHFRELFLNQFAGFWWYYIIGGLVVPPLLILVPWTRNIWGVVIAAVLIDIAMWFERYFIVVAALRVPLMPYDARNYGPTWVEWSIITASFALFALLITVFIKIFPIIAVWEVAEQMEEEGERAPVVAPASPATQPRLAGEPAGGGA